MRGASITIKNGKQIDDTRHIQEMDMAELVDPEKLVSLAQIAREYGFHPKYLSSLAAKKKFKAWHIGNTWITLREHVEEYVKNSRPPGRPPRKPAKKSSKR